MVSERIGRIVVAIDTSGSISQQAIAKVGEALASIGEACNPEEIRVLWWDTMVHGEQVFAGTYDGMKELLKPLGGGGTLASCVSQYVVETGLQADCLINFTDGYLESNIDWATSIPTLWIVDGNDRFSPPKGKVVKFSAEG
jgi:predicted metal-dependent peptidase